MARAGPFHTGTIRRGIAIRAPAKKVWGELGRVAGLARWAAGVESTILTSEKRRGVGAVRVITFENGDTVEEHVVAWESGSRFTYVATDGLPLRAYVATISLTPGKRSVRVTWQSYLSSQEMSKKQFSAFLASMGSFYEESLGNLKALLEGSAR